MDLVWRLYFHLQIALLFYNRARTLPMTKFVAINQRLDIAEPIAATILHKSV